MATTVERYVTPEEIRQLEQEPYLAAQVNACAIHKPFVFFAAFDGTNNDKNNVPLSGSPYQTSIGNLADMAEIRKSPSFQPRYYPGVGTGGEHGNILNAGPWPTKPLQDTARKAYYEFAYAANDYIQSNPYASYHDLSAVTAGFSRGSAAQVMFTRMVDEEGLKLRDGTPVAPPHSVPITGMVMIDPVYTYVDGNLSLPGNVQGQALAFGALDETRADFRRADYANDPRVDLHQLPGAHTDLGGGYDLNGISASVLESSVNYLRNSGVDLGPVPPHLRFDASSMPVVHSEVYPKAWNGDRLTDGPGKWPEAGSPGHRATTGMPAPSGIDADYPQDCAPVSQSRPITPNSSTEEMFYALTDAALRNDVQGMNQVAQAYTDSPQGQAWLASGAQYLQQQEQEQLRQQQEAQQQSGPMRISR